MTVDRHKGCIVGGAIGDGLGSAYEGRQPPLKVDLDIEWQLTDDTQLTLATCEAIAKCGAVDAQCLANTFADWFRRRKLSRLGAATTKALSELVQGAHWALVGRKGERAAGNGAAMRIAPVAFFLDAREDNDRRLLRDVCRITHHNDEAYAGALAIVAAISAAADGRWTGGSNLLAIVTEVLPDTAVRDRLQALCATGYETGILTVAEKHGCSGYVVDSVPLALYAARSVTQIGFEGMVVDLIRSGGDTDTNASLAGQVAGSLLGFDWLPSHLVERVPELDQLISAAESLTATG